MTVDLVKPLKIESPIEGTETDVFPTETDTGQDYIDALGYAFNSNPNFLLQKIGRLLINFEPDTTVKPTLLLNGEYDYVEFFNSSTQITANRIAKTSFSYNISTDPTTETWEYYDTDGTTVLRTITITYTYTGTDITNITMVTT